MRIASRAVIVVTVAGSLAACARDRSASSRSPDPADVSPATPPACEAPVTVTVRITEARSRSPYPFVSAAVTVEPSDPCTREDGGVAHGRGERSPKLREVLALPKFPGVRFDDARELCSTELSVDAIGSALAIASALLQVIESLSAASQS